jgi:hypothetical protein
MLQALRDIAVQNGIAWDPFGGRSSGRDGRFSRPVDRFPEQACIDLRNTPTPAHAGVLH